MDHDEPLQRPGVGDDADDLGELIHRAYATSVGVDAAARHLWVIDRRGGRGRRRWPRVRQGALAAVVSLAMLSTSGIAVAASGHALPGETLYRVKRGAELVHLLVSRDAEADARLHLKFARARLDEAVAVAPARPAVLPRLLDDAATSVERAEEVGGEAFVGEASNVRTEASETISALSGSVDAEVAMALEAVAQRLATVAVALETGDAADGRGVAVEEPADESVEASDDVLDEDRTAGDDPAPTGAEASSDDADDAEADGGPTEGDAEDDEAEPPEVTLPPGDRAPDEGEGRSTGRRDPDEEGEKQMPPVRELGGMLAERSDPADGRRDGDASDSDTPEEDDEAGGEAPEGT